MENIGILVSIVVASIACILSLIAAFGSYKKVNQLEGQHLQKVITLKERVDAMDGIVKSLYGMAGDIQEIKTDIRWLKSAVRSNGKQGEGWTT